MMKKKKTRRGGRARHPMLDQDAKMMSKTQDEPKAKPQVQVKINHQDGDLGMKKKKTRRGGKARARHPMLIQNAKMMSKDQEKRDLTQSSAIHVKIWDTLPQSVLPSLIRRFKQKKRGKVMRSNI